MTQKVKFALVPSFTAFLPALKMKFNFGGCSYLQRRVLNYHNAACVVVSIVFIRCIAPTTFSFFSIYTTQRGERKRTFLFESDYKHWKILKKFPYAHTIPPLSVCIITLLSYYFGCAWLNPASHFHKRKIE